MIFLKRNYQVAEKTEGLYRTMTTEETGMIVKYPSLKYARQGDFFFPDSGSFIFILIKLS